MADAPNNSAIEEKFTAYLKAKGKRKTPERYKILEKVLTFPKQFTVEDLSQAMAADFFMVSTATLYYTVDLMVEAGILRRMNTGGGALAYERVDHVSHIHLMCEVCGKVKLVKDLNFMAYMNARKFMAFTTRYYNLTVYGTCNDCARKLKRSRRTVAVGGNNKSRPAVKKKK